MVEERKADGFTDIGRGVLALPLRWVRLRPARYDILFASLTIQRERLTMTLKRGQNVSDTRTKLDSVCV